MPDDTGDRPGEDDRRFSMLRPVSAVLSLAVFVFPLRCGAADHPPLSATEEQGSLTPPGEFVPELVDDESEMQEVDAPVDNSERDELKGAMQPVLRLSGEPGAIAEMKIDLAEAFTVESWVNLDEGIGNEDALLGSSGGRSFNFSDGHLRVYVGGERHDAVVAHRPLKAGTWTHVAVVRGSDARFRIYLDGELDTEGGEPFSDPLKGLDIGRNVADKGTAGAFTEFRVWDIARSAEEIRDGYRSSFVGSALPSHLVHFYTGAGPWGALLGAARVEQTRDFPELLTTDDARVLNEKLAHYRALFEKPGNLEKGGLRFGSNCAICHVVKGEGGRIGPDLSGAGAMGAESLLRNILTPNAQLESGYYRYDVELTSGDLLSGYLVKESADAITVRPLGSDERTIPRSEIRKTSVSKRSFMPEEILENMPEAHVVDLFTYLRSLK